MLRRRLIGEAGAFLAWLMAAGCGSSSTPAAKPAAGLSAPASPVPASPAIEGVASPKPIQAQAPTAPSRAPVLTISPEAATITADDPGVQLLLRRQSADGTVKDLTGLAAWRVDPPGFGAIEAGGYLRPLAAGKVSVKAVFEGQEVAALINVEPRENRSWDFASDVVPILTRLGCNTGSCHGRADGQNGFHLSLSGYDPDGDYQSLVREGGQRRVALLDPEQSLFLTKATGRTPHGGGPRVAAAAPEYRLLLDWIKAGAPRQKGKSHGAVVAVSIEPETIRLAEPGPQQLRVVAQHADGHKRDVTRQALYKVNDDASSSVSPDGRGELLRRAEADVIVRYRSHVLSARLATVINPALELDNGRLPRRNFIDDELHKQLSSLKVPPSPPASDAAFLRRISLDLTGEQPTPEQIRQFLADKDHDKRLSLVDRLLARPKFVLFWRIKLGDLLQISQGRQGNGAYRYQEWIDRCLNENTPWDVMVTKMLTASRDQFADRAYSLMTSSATQAAFRFGDESPSVRDKYGRTTFGQSCLLARRLIEAGVSFVTLNDRGAGPLGWDTHAQNFPTIKNTLAPPLDQGLAALLGDLADRRLLENTLVVMMGEFGRTPKINQNAGRDHHGRANSVLMAGAGVPSGLVLRKTDARGDLPTERPVTPADLAAVLYLKLGIDPEHKFEAPDGRPIRLVDAAQPPRELL